MQEITEFNDFLSEIINQFEDEVQEIVNQVIENGIDSLSDNQKERFEDEVESLYIKECPVCSEPIYFSDMAFVIDNGKCSICQNKWDKMESE